MQAETAALTAQIATLTALTASSGTPVKVEPVTVELESQLDEETESAAVEAPVVRAKRKARVK